MSSAPSFSSWHFSADKKQAQRINRERDVKLLIGSFLEFTRVSSSFPQHFRPQHENQNNENSRDNTNSNTLLIYAELSVNLSNATRFATAGALRS